MHRDDIAEFLLALVTALETATPTTGDLSEEATARGNLWFWSGVLQTFFSQIWRDLSDFPLRMLRLALWAWMAVNILTFMMGASAAVVTFMTAKAGRAAALTPSGDRWALSCQQWAGSALAIAVVPLLIGWLLARRSRGREFAAVIATTSLFSVLAASASFAAFILPRLGIGPHIVQRGLDLQLPPAWPVWVLNALFDIVVPLLVGWLLARRSEGRELAAAIAAISISVVVRCLIYYLLFPKLPAGSPLEFISGSLGLLVGSTLFRRRHAERHGGLHAT